MSESGKKGFFDGRFGKYLLPGILLQSVLIGGGYATGRKSYPTEQNLEQKDGLQELVF